MNELDIAIINLKLTTMLAGSHFSICAVDSCLKLAGVHPHGEAYKRLNVLHCINFSDMPESVFSQIPAMLGEVFNSGKTALTLSIVNAETGVVRPAPAQILQLRGAT